MRAPTTTSGKTRAALRLAVGKRATASARARSYSSAAAVSALVFASFHSAPILSTAGGAHLLASGAVGGRRFAKNSRAPTANTRRADWATVVPIAAALTLRAHAHGLYALLRNGDHHRAHANATDRDEILIDNLANKHALWPAQLPLSAVVAAIFVASKVTIMSRILRLIVLSRSARTTLKLRPNFNAFCKRGGGRRRRLLVESTNGARQTRSFAHAVASRKVEFEPVAQNKKKL